MIKQTLFFSNPAHLSLRYNQLVISLGENEPDITRPIEDIGVVIVENQQVHMTVPLLNALTDNNVAVVFCNDKAMPNSMLMPLDSNTTQQETYRYQMEASLPTKKRLWKELVESKIRNQAELLNRLGKNGNMLRPYYQNVLSGDSDNREGLAAKLYWQELCGHEFYRERHGEGLNSLLNYGYTILRAAVTRALLGSGLFPAFGLFHRNRYNAFPLADDVMEPYRPFVDEIAYEMYAYDERVKLDKSTKSQLVRVLFADVVMEGKVRPLELALSFTTASLAKAFKDNKQHLVLPEFA